MNNNQYLYLPTIIFCSVFWQHLVNLFARLANDNIGYVDWDPYIPKVGCPLNLVTPFHHPVHNLAPMFVLVFIAHALICALIFVILANGVYFMAIATCQKQTIKFPCWPSSWSQMASDLHHVWSSHWATILIHACDNTNIYYLSVINIPPDLFSLVT